eukprot:10452197-Ditylum_brightwellii.AAC.1
MVLAMIETCQDQSSDKKECLPASSLRPGSNGWSAALRVRHLHARVRRSILSQSASSMRETKIAWDKAKLGVPINQEDMAGTLLAFSINVIEGIEFIAGTDMAQNDQLDYLALWRYLGWLLGIDTIEQISTSSIDDDGKAVLLKTSNPARSYSYPNNKSLHLPPIDPCCFNTDSRLWPSKPDEVIVHAETTLDSILNHLLHPDESSKALVHHVLRMGRPAETEQDKDGQPKSFVYKFRTVMCRRFLGCPLADALGLAKTSSYNWLPFIIMTWILLFIMRLYTLAAMKISMARNRMLRFHRKTFEKFYRVWNKGHNKRMCE